MCVFAMISHSLLAFFPFFLFFCFDLSLGLDGLDGVVDSEKKDNE